MRHVRIADAKDLQEGSKIVVSGIDRVDLCLVRLKGEYYAVTNVCTHKGERLSDGEISNGYLICTWHKAHFDMKTGKHSWPARRELRSYEVSVEGESIFVSVPT